MRLRLPDKSTAEKIGRTLLKEAAVLLLIILAAVGIELVVFNYHSFVRGRETDLLYESGKDLPEGVKRVDQLDNGLRLVLNKSTYIKKVQLMLDVPEKTSYSIYTRYQNMFGKTEGGTENDVYWPELGTGYTNIGEKVTVVRVAFPKDSNVDVNSVRLFTETAVNKFRVVFLALLLFFISFFVRKWNWLEKKPEWVLVIIGLLIGSYFVFMNGIQENGWDEEVHFSTAYQMSFWGDQVGSNDTIQLMRERVPKDAYNTYEERALYTQYMNDGYQRNVEYTERTMRASHRDTGYILQAMAIWVGRHLHLAFSHLYMLGRFVNLCTYLFLMFCSIKLMPKRKEVILALALIPTQIFIASTYTYDVMVHGLLLLGFVLWIKAALEKKSEKTIYYLVGSILAFSIGSLSKAVYIPLLLLCCLVPKEKFKSPKQYHAFWGIILGSCLLILLTFALPIVQHTINGQVGITGDPRGGDTDSVLQLKSIIRHPFQYLYLFIKEVLGSAGTFLLGNAGIANFGRMRELSSGFQFITMPWFLFVVFTRKEEKTFRISVQHKVALGGVFLIILAFIWSAMYLSYTPVGLSQINGVQARYYFPILAPAIIAISGMSFQVNRLKNECYIKLISGIPVVLLLTAIFSQFVFQQCL